MILLMIEILHDLIYQNCRKSCRNCKIVYIYIYIG